MWNQFHKMYPVIPLLKVDTMSSLWRWAVQKYAHRELLGTRDVLREEDEIQSNGKIFKKLHLGMTQHIKTIYS